MIDVNLILQPNPNSLIYLFKVIELFNPNVTILKLNEI